MADPDARSDDTPDADPDEPRDADLDALRDAVEEKYDFEDFGPADMAEMTAEEWEAAFDPDSWIVGEELLDRVEAELKNRIASREVFATVERVTENGAQRLLAYSDEGYALVYPDGSVEGEGTVLRDVKPTVAVCSMTEYEIQDPPESVSLPRPEEVVEGSGEFGNLMLQVIAAAQILAGLALLGASVLADTSIVAPVAGVGFLLVGVFLFVVVANARLSDRFRAEEYRQRLRVVEGDADEWPEFVPDELVPVADADEARADRE